jgi:RNA polymerase sigma-70 factor (ECF subfamily)
MAGRGDLESLVELARSGSSAAWGKVYEALSPSVFRLCRRVLPSREDAEDAVSEIFLKARLHLSQYDGNRPFAPWLYRVAANHCWDDLRKRRGRGGIEDGEADLGNLEDDAPSPQDVLLEMESRDSMRRLVGGLDERSRMAIVLRYYADMSYEEIGHVLGISGSFVGVLLLRARQTLRRRFHKS